MTVYISEALEVLLTQAMQVSMRGEEWVRFAGQVLHHIEGYTVPQYGDYGEDSVTNWSPEDCILAIEKYCSRFGSNMRGQEEQLRDLLKIAHYACLAHSKMAAVTESKNSQDGGDIVLALPECQS